jgi:hypothetical protein
MPDTWRVALKVTPPTFSTSGRHTTAHLTPTPQSRKALPALLICVPVTLHAVRCETVSAAELAGNAGFTGIELLFAARKVRTHNAHA